MTVAALLDCFAAVTLDQLNAAAALQSRIDRKYVIMPERLVPILDQLHASARVLEIDGRRSFGYESVYFDTPELHSYLTAARRRPHRFKVRTRAYLDSGECSVEVKLRDWRRTVKHRHEHPSDERRVLTAGAAGFIDTFGDLASLRVRLRPTLTTTYRRSTLLVGHSRVTIDEHLACTADDLPDRVAGLDGAVIVETKSIGGPCHADRLLWSAHVRPVTISKFGTGLAALHPDLPANKWHRTLARHVRLTEQSTPATLDANWGQRGRDTS